MSYWLVAPGREYWRHSFDSSWRVDETYVKVKGQWKYLYRAIDKNGKTIDFYLSQTRSMKAANAAYGAALDSMKKSGKCNVDVEHRQYLNNHLETDRGKLKLLIRPVRGFKSMKTAYATIAGFEVMRIFKKGQMKA